MKESFQAVKEISKLLHVPEAELKQVLSQRAVAARGDVIMKGHTMELAIYARDAFAKVNRLIINFLINES